MSRKRVIGLAIAIIIVAALIVGVKAFTAPGAPGGMPNHIPIAQARGEIGQVVKVGGDVVPGSVNWDEATRSLTFLLSGEDDRMPVTYRGLAPKDFKPGIAMVVEGTYVSNGVFEATSITTTTSPLCKACHG
jgi:cytochrome c-type biogenesis protein CcmE